MVADRKANISSFLQWPAVQISKSRHNCSSQLNWALRQFRSTENSRRPLKRGLQNAELPAGKTLMATKPSTPYSLPPTPCLIDILAIAAHRDDVEQTCGGTLLAMHARGWITGILDLTQGESGTRGTAADREAEATAAARILNVAHREALDLPDGNVQNTLENRLKLAAVLRRLRPRVVILPYWQGRHPDHYTTATLGYQACFISRLAQLQTPCRHPPPRPSQI